MIENSERSRATSTKHPATRASEDPRGDSALRGVERAFLALQRAVGNRAVAQALQPRGCGSSHGSSSEANNVGPKPAPNPVAQRAVGFEFETSWEMAATERDPSAPGTVRMVEMPIKQQITGSDGWQLHADFNKTPVAEFITDPVDEDEWLGLFDQMNALEDATGRIVKAQGKGPDHWIKISSKDTKSFWMKKGDPEMRAAPQMTAGVRLDRLISLMRAMSWKRNRPGARELLNKPRGEGAEKLALLMNGAASRAEAFCKNLATGKVSGIPAQTVDERLVGVLAFLGLYVLLGQKHAPLDYAKELSPLMARTDLGLIPNELRNHAAILDGVMYVGDVQGADRLLFASGFNIKGRVEMVGPTIKEWIDGIQGGSDPLRVLSENQMSNLDRMEGVNRKARVGPSEIEYVHQAQGLIVELRGMREELPRTKWSTVAEKLQAYIKGLNNPSESPSHYAGSEAYPEEVAGLQDPVGRVS